MTKKAIIKIISIVTTISILMSFTINVLANETVTTIFDLPTTMTEGGNAEDGYTLTGTETIGVVASFKESLDIDTQSLQIKSGITANGNWDYLALTNTDTRITELAFEALAEEEAYEAVVYRLAKVGDTALAIYPYTINKSSDVSLLAKIESFDFSATHSYEFDCLNGNWWLVVDGKAVVDLTANDNEVVSERLDAFSKSGEAYIQIASYGYAANFSSIKITEKAPFSLSGTTLAGGNTSDGYTLTGDKSKASVLRLPMDITSEDIQFKSAIPSNWAYIAFANTTNLPTSLFNADQKTAAGAVAFRLVNTSNLALSIYAFTGSSSAQLAKIEPFDFTKSHTYGFDNIDGNWWLTVDGHAVADLTAKDDAVVTERLNALSKSGKTYVQFAAYEYDTDFSNIKIAEKLQFIMPSTMTAGGSAEEGYTLTGTVNGTIAAFKKPLNIVNQSVQFKTTFPGAWEYIAFTNAATRLTALNNATEKETLGAITFRLANIGDTALAIYAYTGSSSALLAKVESFDFTVAHTYGFDNIDGKWWLTVDGSAVANLTSNDDEVVTTRLNALSKSGEAYVQFASYEGKADFSAVKVVETPFNLPSTMIADGNENDGYTLTGTVNGTIASLKKSFDIKYQSIQFKTTIPGAWDYIAFTNSATRLTALNNATEKETLGAVTFRLANIGDTALAIYAYTGSSSALLAKIEAFDFGVAHTYGFNNIDGNWWLTVDGSAVANLTANDDTVVAERLSKLSESGKAYVQLASYEGKADFSEIKVDSYALGDSNKDGKINLRDLVSMKKKLVKLTTVLGIDDLNGDGTVNSVDLGAMRKKLLNIK